MTSDVAHALDGIVWPQAAAISRDGTRVAVVTRRWDPAAERDVRDLQLLRRGTGTWRVLPVPPEPHEPQFAPDGRTLAFTALDDGGVRQLFVAAEQTITALTDLAGGVRGAIAWSPCGRRLAFSASAVAGPRAGDPVRVTRRFWRWDGAGPIEHLLAEIWAVDAAGGDPRALTTDDAIASDPCWSPDGSAILYRSRCAPDCDDPMAAPLKVVAGHGTSVLVGPEWRPARGAWLSDGKIAFVGVEPGATVAVQAHLFVTAPGAEPERRDPESHADVAAMLETDMPSLLPFAAAPILVDASAQHAYVRVQIGGSIEIHRTALRGEPAQAPVCAGDRACYPLDLASGVLLAGISSFLAPLELVAVDLHSGTEEQLSDFGASSRDIVSGYPSPRRVTATRDGAEVEGWFAAPTTSQAPAPTILYTHGGPHFGLGHVFFCDVQLLRAAGFGVLLVNQRGSTGYGEQFATSLHGRWGDVDVADLVAVVDRAVDEGLADPQRLGVCGASGGGHLTCSLVAQTSRFAAAVAENPVTNFVSMYGTSDIGVPFSVRQLAGAAPDAFTSWLAQSPVAQTGGWTTPTLLIHGDEDLRCPREQSEQFYRALCEAGCPAEMLLIPGADHVGTVFGPTPMRRVQDEALVEWMLRWLR